MTLAVAALAVAAIFMSSSAGLLSRFYDREREVRLAAESALEIARSRLTWDAGLAVPDTGTTTLLTGLQLPDASGNPLPRLRANVYAAATGDTSGFGIPHLTLLAVVYDNAGTRGARRMDLHRESFSRYAIVVDSFPAGVTFGPGIVSGRVHSNTRWRAATGSAAEQVFLDTVTAVEGFDGAGVYADSAAGVAPIPYPRDSTYAHLTPLAASGNLLVTPVSGGSVGAVRGTRIEFLAVDADGDGGIGGGEGFARVFDLAAGMDTSRLRMSLDPNTNYTIFGFLVYSARPWNDPLVQNQCGAFYERDNQWQFFPVATHRAAWARPVIQSNSRYPRVTNGDMNVMDDFSWQATDLILRQPTASCLPAGSPYLMPTERLTNASCIVTASAGDIYPFGTAPSGCFASGAPYGGTDTTFTAVVRTCSINSAGQCAGGVSVELGRWNAFAGTPVSGIASSVRQAGELPFLWPVSNTWNATTQGVMRATGSVFVSGTFRGALTLMVDGSAILLDDLTYAADPDDPAAANCTNQLGVVAVADVLVADNALNRARRVGYTGAFSFLRYERFFTQSRDVQIDAHLMSLRGTVGIENPGAGSVQATPCVRPTGLANSTAVGCLQLHGGFAAARMSALHSGENTGARWAGTPSACQQRDDTRPPYFPLTNRLRVVRSVDLSGGRVNTPARVRNYLLSLKGRTL
jgi:hypothetical protein